MNLKINNLYYINLDFRRDRDYHMKKHLKLCAWPVTRVSGVLFDKAPEDLGIKMDRARGGMKGVAGIWSSHKKCLELIAQTASDGGYIILEDDVHINAKFWDGELLALPEDLPENWQILLFSPRYKIKDGVPAPSTPSNTVLLKNYMYGSSGAHFVVLRNAKVAQQILDKMRESLVTDVDVFYIDNFETYGFQNSLIAAGGFGSNHSGEVDIS